jgi:hypothetical protein
MLCARRRRIIRLGFIFGYREKAVAEARRGNRGIGIFFEEFKFRKCFHKFASINGANELALQAARSCFSDLAAADPRSSRPYAF